MKKTIIISTIIIIITTMVIILPSKRTYALKENFNFQIKKRKIDYTKPMVALTFDDGPSKYTIEILDILEKYDIVATFFVVGNKAKNFPLTLQRMLLAGCEIGNHTYSHKNLTNLSLKKLTYQIEETNNIVYNATTITPIYLRPTYGSINRYVRKNTNMKIVMWNVDSKDWKYRNKEKIAKRVLSTTDDKDIILMHDIYKSTVLSLDLIIPELLGKGYQFVTISELKKIAK